MRNMKKFALLLLCLAVVSGFGSCAMAHKRHYSYYNSHVSKIKKHHHYNKSYKKVYYNNYNSYYNYSLINKRPFDNRNNVVRMVRLQDFK